MSGYYQGQNHKIPMDVWNVLLEFTSGMSEEQCQAIINFANSLKSKEDREGVA